MISKNKYSPRTVRVVSLLLALVSVGVLLVVVSMLFGQDRSKSVRSDRAYNTENTFACSKNSQDVCISAPTVDLFPAGSEAAENSQLRDNSNDVWKSIGGRVAYMSGTSLTLTTTSGRSFEVHFPVEIESWWNKNIGPNYGDYAIGLGDTIRVDYVEPADQARNTIQADQIVSSVLAIDPSSVSEARIRRYGDQKN